MNQPDAARATVNRNIHRCSSPRMAFGSRAQRARTLVLVANASRICIVAAAYERTRADEIFAKRPNGCCQGNLAVTKPLPTALALRGGSLPPLSPFDTRRAKLHSGLGYATD